jgi:hypothetical protein
MLGGHELTPLTIGDGRVRHYARKAPDGRLGREKPC